MSFREKLDEVSNELAISVHATLIEQYIEGVMSAADPEAQKDLLGVEASILSSVADLLVQKSRELLHEAGDVGGYQHRVGCPWYRKSDLEVKRPEGCTCARRPWKN